MTATQNESGHRLAVTASLFSAILFGTNIAGNSTSS
jgi:hypothetical protein